MTLGRLTIFGYKKVIDETGYLFAVRSYRYGVHNRHVRDEYGSGFVFSIVLFDYHICFDVKLTLPAQRETRQAGKAAKI